MAKLAQRLRCVAGGSFCLFMALLGATAAAAQLPTPRQVIVTVLDSDGLPVGMSEVTLLGPDARLVLAHAVADTAGVAKLSLSPTTQPATLIVRRIGYAVVQHELAAITRDTTITCILESRAQTLDAVRTQAEADLRHYSVGAQEIAHANRGLFDALIVLHKLRPQMLGDSERLCDPTDKVWINGRRIMFGTTPPLPHYNIRDTILASIKGEHISEMRYISCWDKPAPGIQRDALYITLKAGIDWDWKHGSFVADPVLGGKPDP